MKNKLVNVTALVIAAVIVISFGAEASNVIVSRENIVYEDKFVSVNLSIPVIHNFGDWMQVEYLNALLRQQHLGFAHETAALAREVYELSSEENALHFWPFEVRTSFQVTYNQNGILSLVTQSYDYTGGAHGFTQQEGFNRDLKSGSKFTLAALNNPDYRQIILDEINRQIDQEPNVYFDDCIPVDNFNEDYFYLTEEGVVVFYQLYEIACYASGIQEFLIPWSLLKTICFDTIP